MNYRSVASLNRDILRWAEQLPRDVELIVGVPRSGLLAANLLALYRNLAMTDIAGLIEGRLIQSGKRRPEVEGDGFLATPRKALVVDDSVCAGTQLNEVKQRIRAAGLIHDIRYAAVYVRPSSEEHVDFFFERVAMPRVFEWNLMHHCVITASCFDIDGVLCRDPTEDENDDGRRYEEFLTNVDPLIIPSVKIGWLVTCRLEKYRRLTEAWLDRCGVQYGELIMMDLPNKAARVASGSHAEFKAANYAKTGAELFIESSLSQAAEIARLSGKPVWCAEGREMVTPASGLRDLRRTQRFFRLICTEPGTAMSKMRRVAGRALRARS